MTRFYTVPSVAFNNGVAISFPSTRLTYGSSSVAITFSVTGSGSSTQLSALLTPSGTDFSFMEEIDVDVAVSYGNPFPIQLTTASFAMGRGPSRVPSPLQCRPATPHQLPRPKLCGHDLLGLSYQRRRSE